MVLCTDFNCCRRSVTVTSLSLYLSERCDNTSASTLAMNFARTDKEQALSKLDFSLSRSRSKLFNGGMRAGQIFQVDQLPSLIVLLWCQEADKSNSLIQSFALCPVVGKHLVRSHIHSRSMDMLTTASNWLVLLLCIILTETTIRMIELPTRTVIIIQTG